MLSSLVVVRPAAAAATDAVLTDVVGDTGRVVIGSDFADERVASLLSWAVLAAAWQFPDVFAVADAAVLRARHRPVRTLADPAAPDYGRWPAPAVGWASIQSVVPWSAPPFSAPGISGRPGSRERALRAVNLPAPSGAAHPLAEALVLACLLGTVPHAPDPWTVGTRLLDASQVMAARAGAFVLVLGQRILRYAPPDAWEPLFAQPFDSPQSTPRALRDRAGRRTRSRGRCGGAGGPPDLAAGKRGGVGARGGRGRRLTGRSGIGQRARGAACFTAFCQA